MSSKYQKNDFQKISDLKALLTARATGQEASDSDYRNLRSELLRNDKISSSLPAWLRDRRSLDSFWGFIKQKFSTYAKRREFLEEEFNAALNLIEFGDIEVQQKPQDSISSHRDGDNTNSSEKRKVFIVHGRDNESKQEVARYIEGLGLQSIILHEQASSGMTIIEKIEHYSKEADFALVLYTPCDNGRGIHESEIPLKNRARQNVVFEHGYLMAKLGRTNVCALVKGEIEKPNDISGVVYVGLDQAGAWKQEVQKELKACGYPI